MEISGQLQGPAALTPGKAVNAFGNDKTDSFNNAKRATWETPRAVTEKTVLKLLNITTRLQKGDYDYEGGK